MNYYSIERSTDHLAHYGVKGMKWGVRRALARGNEKALDRHFRKAAKKLRKLQDIGLNSKKYAAKSAAYGAAAAGAGALSIGSIGLISNLAKKPSEAMAAKFLKEHPEIHLSKGSGRITQSTKNMDLYNRYYNIVDTPQKIKDYGNKPRVLAKTKRKIITGIDKSGKPIYGDTNHLVTLTNDQLYRIGTGALAAGLAAKSAQNAYRASHGAKYRQKALDFKNQMDESFRGTKYEGQYIVPPKKKKKRR